MKKDISNCFNNSSISIKNEYNFMNEAYIEAKKAYEKDEIPIGAIIVLEGVIIARAHNLKESTNLITDHAEILAIQIAAQKLNTWKLTECELYTTLEPCLMCYSAIKQSRIKKVYVGAKSELSKEFSFRKYITGDKIISYDIELKKCQGILTNFFKNKRMIK